MTVILNARFLTQPVSGVQRFAENIAAELLTMRDDVVLAAPMGAKPRTDGPLSRAPVEHVGRFRGHLWEQVDLPLYLRSMGNPLLLGLTNTNPVSYENKISTHHDITYVRFPESYATSFRALYSVVAPRMLRTSKTVLTVSEHSRVDIADHYGLDPNSISVVHNAPIEPPTEAWSVCGNEPIVRGEYFLTVGSRNLHKNIDRLIEAFLSYRARSGSVTRLVVVGGSTAAFATGKSLSISSEGVVFLGRISDEDLHNVYANAKAFIFPSLYEGFGIPPLEAQAHGIPVVSSEVASLPEVLAESALYFRPRDKESIIHALNRIDRDDSLREELVRRGRKNVRRFSWAKSAQQVVTILDVQLEQ